MEGRHRHHHTFAAQRFLDRRAIELRVLLAATYMLACHILMRQDQGLRHARGAGRVSVIDGEVNWSDYCRNGWALCLILSRGRGISRVGTYMMQSESQRAVSKDLSYGNSGCCSPSNSSMLGIARHRVFLTASKMKRTGGNAGSVVRSFWHSRAVKRELWASGLLRGEVRNS